LGGAQAADTTAAMSNELKHLGPAKVAARIVFACGITALVVMSVYFGILWLVGAR